MRRFCFFKNRKFVPLLLGTARRSLTSDNKSNNDASGDALDDLFKELESCQVSTSTSKEPAAAPASPKAGEAASKKALDTRKKSKTPSKDGAKLEAERTKNRRLQRLVKEAEQEVEALASERAGADQAKRMATRVPSASAKSYLSAHELIAEKSPQHLLTRNLGTVSSSPSPPALSASGSVAMTSLVGRVVRPAFQLPVAAAAASSLPRRVDGTAEDDFADLGVEFVIPFTPSAPQKATVLVRCYGPTLSSFARTYVSVGDVVHVLGHMVPLKIGEESEYSVAVCALPVGGNITIVVPSAEKKGS